MGVVAVIPARGGSKGLPRKNLQPIGGVPLVGWAVRAALAAKSVTAVYVSTEDAEIAMVAREYGAEVIDRPAALADDKAATLPVIRHALDWMESPPKRIVVLQCTNPLTTGADIDQAVAKAERLDVDAVASARRDHSFLVRDSAGVAIPLTFDPSELPRRQDLVDQWRLDGSFFVVRTSGLSSAPSLLCGSIALHEMPAERSVDIDTPLDLHLARAMYEYHRQWIVIGSAPSTPEWLSVVRARYPRAVTITTNAGGKLFEPPDRPDYYFLSDSNGCEEYGELVQALASRGTRTITRKRAESALKGRGVEWFDEFIKDERPGTMLEFRPGHYCDSGLSGLFCLQYAVNHGACGVHLVGFEGYGDGQHWWDKPGVPAKNKNTAFTEKYIRPFVQSVVNACPEVTFHFYGDLNYPISGRNVQCESSSKNGGEVSKRSSLQTLPMERQTS